MMFLGYDAAHAVTNPQLLWLCAQDLHGKKKGVRAGGNQLERSRSDRNEKGDKRQGMGSLAQCMASMHETANIKFKKRKM